MPTILFVMKYPLHRRENLQTKFDGQMEATQQLGWDAYCIGWDAKGMYLLGGGKPKLLCRNRCAIIRGYDHTKIFIDLMKAVRLALRRISVDVLYLRYMPTFWNAPKAIRQLKNSGGKLIVEYPTYPVAQENNRFFIRRQVFRYTDHVMRKIHPMVDLFTAIGDDCGGTLHGKPAMNIVNGVNVSVLPRYTARVNPPDIRLLALASMSGWHGYDRLIRSLAAYTGDENIQIVFVGGDGDGSLAQWKQLTKELQLQDQIIFFGPRYGDELEEIVLQCDAGIGSLGMFRYGLQQGMTLKAREYMARGLPFVSAVRDPALPENRGFFLQVPNDETPIDMAEIIAFVKQTKADTGLPDAMRAYADEKLSWRGVFAGILERVQP